MEWALYLFALVLVKALQSLPLPWVAWIGRRLGSLAYWLDARHRRTAFRNLTNSLGGEKSSTEIVALTREHFRRLGENYCSAVKTASMPWNQLKHFVEFTGIEKMLESKRSHLTQSYIVAIGHFGNFELFARFGNFAPGWRCATTYRALNQPLLNRFVQSLRQQSGCLFFERRSEVAALRTALSKGGMILGLLADQHAGRHGVQVPFFGQLCSTTAAPAVLALRYNCLLYTGACYRTGLGRWRIHAGERIRTLENGQPRSVESITLDINKALETAVRRDPANWFWVHNRWKPAEAGARNKLQSPAQETSTSSETMQLS